MKINNSTKHEVFSIDMWKRLDRFLILGTEGGTYYISQKELTKENALNYLSCLETDHVRTINQVVDVLSKGKAFKRNAGLFALALAVSHSSKDIRKYAYSKVNDCISIGADILTFVSYIDSLRGWGTGLRHCISHWYLNKNVDELAFQVLKYQNRSNWSHADVLRMSHPKPDSDSMNAVFAYIVGGVERVKTKNLEHLLPSRIIGYELIKQAAERNDINQIIELVSNYKLPWNTIPNTHRSNPDVLSAILENNMPIMNMIRELGKMSKAGLLTNGSNSEKIVLDKITSSDLIKKSRALPMRILIGLNGYSNGKPMSAMTWKQSSEGWNVNANIVSGLEQAFTLSFDNVVPSNKRICIALDVSGSMVAPVMGSSITCRDGSAAMAYITGRTEKDVQVLAFTNEITKIEVDFDKISLKNFIDKISGLRFGSTDCSAPMQYSLKHGTNYDAFFVYTDSETGSGYWGTKYIEPSKALVEYRTKVNPDAKLGVIGMASNGFSIADPNDPGMLDVVGFDPSVPSVLSAFIGQETSINDEVED